MSEETHDANWRTGIGTAKLAERLEEFAEFASGRLIGLDRVCWAAEDLFQILTTDDVKSDMWRHQLKALGAALYGEDDPRVKALRPEPKYHVGDWVVSTEYDGGKRGAMLVTAVRPGGEMELQPKQEYPALGPAPRRYWVGVSSPKNVRIATAEEIAEAQGA